MNPSIPASQLVSVIPGVLGAGGSPLSLNAVFLTQDTSIPIDTVQPFSTLADVQDWFGADSSEAHYAGIYFSGFVGANVLPGTLYFAQYNEAAVAGYLRSGVLDLTLSQLQALSGTIIVSVDGRVVTSPNIDLSSATSFSNAAALIQAGLRTAGSVFTGTGTVTNASVTLTINSTTTGRLHVGDVVVGTDIPVGTTISAFGTYTPGAGTGTVTMSAAATGAAGPEAITVSSTVSVSYDSQLDGFVVTSPTTGDDSAVGFATGTLSAGVKLTSATGAVLSPGAAAATPASAMAEVASVTQNWATFMTVWEPSLTDKLAFAAWVNSAGQRYVYVAWDSDVTALQADASASFGAQVAAAEYNGVVAVWNPSGDVAAFVCGLTASIDFSETQGRVTYAYKGQAGLSADVTDATIANNLVANGYNFYGAYATANQQFTMLQPGQIAGAWRWIDPYVNQIYMNSQFQLAFMELLTNVKSIPYNTRGYGLMRAAALDPINEALNFGSIQPGVTLSAAQIAEVNTAAGARISDTLQTVGWFLQIKDASAQVRGQRGSPPSTFWYTDGGSVQKINLASIDVE
jgi:hypothetical protein